MTQTSASPAAASQPSPGAVVPAESEYRGAPHRKRNLVLIGAAMSLDGTESSMGGTLFPSIAATFGVPNWGLGLLTGLSRLSAAIGGIAWVWFAKKTSRKAALSSALGLWGLWALAAGFAPDFWWLLGLYILAAIGPAGAFAIVPEVIGDSFVERTRGRAVGMLFGAMGLVNAALAPVLGLFLGIPDGWRYGFFIFGGAMVVTGILLLLFYRDPGVGSGEVQLKDIPREIREAHAKITREKVRDVLRTPTVVAVVLSRLLSSAPLITTFATSLLILDYGVDVGVATLVISTWGIGFLVGNWGGGAFSDFAERRAPFIGRTALWQGAQLVSAIAIAAIALWQTSSITPYMVLFFIIGLSGGAVNPLFRPLLMNVVVPELRGTAFGATYAAEAIGIATLTISAGFVADAIGRSAMLVWLGAGILLVNTAVLTVLYFSYPRDRRTFLTRLAEKRERLLAESEGVA